MKKLKSLYLVLWIPQEKGRNSAEKQDGRREWIRWGLICWLGVCGGSSEGRDMDPAHGKDMPAEDYLGWFLWTFPWAQIRNFIYRNSKRKINGWGVVLIPLKAVNPCTGFTRYITCLLIQNLRLKTSQDKLRRRQLIVHHVRQSWAPKLRCVLLCR